jgi:hypothetical protein
MNPRSKSLRSKDGERLTVHPHCLMFFVDETGNETFADPQNPVFGLGGCALLAAAIDPVLRTPWQTMKALHFGGADVPLHASELDPRSLTPTQFEALNTFFRNQTFGRFAVTMTQSDFPSDIEPMQIMPRLIRRRWEELTPRFHPLPVEVAFIHEASDRGNALLEKYFGESVVVIDGKRVPAHHGIMPKGDEALEVADFIIHTAGGQARRGFHPNRPVRRDFELIFRSNPLWSSFFHAVACDRSGV